MSPAKEDTRESSFRSRASRFYHILVANPADDLCNFCPFSRVVGALLRAGADPRRRQKTGASPLIIAAVQGHLAIVRLLLGSPTSGMPLMRAIDKDGKTAIELAAQFGQADVVEYMRRFEASAIR